MSKSAERAGHKRALAAALRDQMKLAEVSQEMLARSCGISRSLVARWLDLDDDAAPSIADVRMFPRGLAGAMALWMKRESIAPPSLSTDIHSMDDFLVVRKELIEVIDAYGEAIAKHDGRITKEERARIRKEVAEAVQTVRALTRRLDEEEHRESIAEMTEKAG